MPLPLRGGGKFPEWSNTKMTLFKEKMIDLSKKIMEEIGVSFTNLLSGLNIRVPSFTINITHDKPLTDYTMSGA